jgi:DNA-directed RNA polymerase subunit L
MTNVLEALVNTVKGYVDQEPASPLHVGEVMNCWTYTAMMDEASIYIQIALNTTNDDELKEMLKDSLKQCQHQSDQLRNFMVKEGIHLPNTSESRPESNPNAVPLGVKLTDDELANGVSIKTASAIMLCASGASQSIRNDVGQMWIEFFGEKITFGTSLKMLMRKRGWIKVPPYYYAPGMPAPK